MRKDLIVSGFCIIIIVGALSGCQESEIEAITFDNITLESSIVEFANASFKPFINKDDVTWKIEVTFQLHNIAERTIGPVEITCYFYDIHDNVIDIQGPKKIEGMPTDYTEKPGDSGFNKFIYMDNDAGEIDHAKIVVVES